MTSDAIDAADPTVLRPITFDPPETPLPTLTALRTFMRNPIEAFPRPLYDRGRLSRRLLGAQFHQLADPSLIQQVLLDKSDAFVRSTLGQRLLRPALGDGMLTTDGEVWRRQRRIAAPAFRMTELKRMAPALDAAGRAAAERLTRASGPAGGVVDVAPEMIRTTFDVITDTVLDAEGVDFDKAQVARDIEVFLTTMGKIDPFDIFDAPRWIPRPWKARGAAATARFRDVAAKVVAAKRAAAASGATPEPPGLTDLLMRAADPEGGAALSDDEVLDNIVTFVGAGHETTSLALTWTLYLLAHSPEWRARLAEEETRVLGGGPVTADAMDALIAHKAALQEAMRLFPPIPTIGRTAISDVEIGDESSGVLRFRAGDNAPIAIWVLHRRPDLWPDPDAFRPQRFLPGAPERHRFAYLPFGGGKHICIGMSFALMEGVAILANVLRRLEPTPPASRPSADVRPVMAVSLRPEGGMPLHLSPR